MRAVLLEKTAPIENGPLAVKDVPEPVPGPGQIVMRVTACGVCRSNLHMIEGDWLEDGVPAKLPIVPGHEVVGRVWKIGPDVDGFIEGDRVGVQPLWFELYALRILPDGARELVPFALDHRRARRRRIRRVHGSRRGAHISRS